MIYLLTYGAWSLAAGLMAAAVFGWANTPEPEYVPVPIPEEDQQ